MMRLALAAFMLAFAAAAHPTSAPHDKPPPPAHAARTPPRHVETLRADIVAGNDQAAPAYVATNASKYVADFRQFLTVRVTGDDVKRNHRRVRYSCETKGCTFVSADQPNNGRFVFPVEHAPAYDVRVIRGKAVLHVSIEADQPVGTYTVRVTPNVGKGERAVAASFTLTTH
jgi:hypothetical protein